MPAISTCTLSGHEGQVTVTTTLPHGIAPNSGIVNVVIDGTGLYDGVWSVDTTLLGGLNSFDLQGSAWSANTAGGTWSLVTLALAVADDGAGDALLTVTGSGVASENVFFRQAVSGNMNDGNNWINVGDRGGDGTSAVPTAPGYYWWYVRSTVGGQTVFSNLVYQNIAAAGASLHEQLQVGALAWIQGLAMPGMQTIMRLKKPGPDENWLLNITVPATLLMTWRTQETFPEGTTNARDDIVLPIYLAFLFPELDDETTTDAQVTLWRQLVRRRFRAGQRIPVIGATHYQTDFAPGPVVDLAVSDTNIGASTMTILCRCREPRGVANLI